MNSDLIELGWTEDQWNRICTAVTEEAQKARVAAQVLPVSGPEDPSTVAIPNFTLTSNGTNPTQPPANRLEVDSDPTLHLTRIAINVQLHTTEAADPELKAALVAFRRAANYIARLEDSLVFNGRGSNNALLGTGSASVPSVYTVKGGGIVPGIFWPAPGKIVIAVPPGASAGPGQDIVNAVTKAIDQLDAAGQLGPYVCILGHTLFEEVVEPTLALVLPRDRILPFLAGPLVRASTVLPDWGAVIALSGSPVELVVASDISVRYVQMTPEPRYIFRVSERVAIRIRENSAIALLRVATDRASKLSVSVPAALNELTMAISKLNQNEKGK